MATSTISDRPTVGITLAREASRVGELRKLYSEARREELTALSPGAYVSTSAWATLPDWEQFAIRMRAIASTRRTQRPIAGLAAASLHGLPVLGPFPEILEVADVIKDTMKHKNVRAVSFAEPPHVEERESLLVLSLADTLADLALRASAEQSISALDAALREERCTKKEVFRALDARRRTYRVARAKRRIDFSDARAQLPGESVSRIRMHETGFAPPTLQVPVPSALGDAFGDFGWHTGRGDLIVGEFDGRAKYEREEYLSGLSTADAVIREKRRESRIASSGVRVFRWTWSDLLDRDAFSRILRTAGVPFAAQAQLPL